MNPEARIHDYIARQAGRGLEPRAGAIVSYLLAVPRLARQHAYAWLRDTHPEVADEVDEALAEREVPTEHTYTTAPASYDGFGTETLAVVGTLDGQPVRHVTTPVEHVEWQRQRYGSGNYRPYTQAEFTELIQYPWAKFVPATKES